MPGTLPLGRVGRLPSCLYGVPDYRSPKRIGLQRDRPQQQQEEVSGSRKRWWQYQAPRNYTAPRNYQVVPVSLPQYGIGEGGGGGTGGGSGWSGGGRGGNGGSDPMRWPTYIFSFLLFGGGLAGYIKAGSTASLMSSAAVATLLLITTTLTGHSIGTWLALGTCLLTAGFMGQRALRSKKLFPSGLVAVLSLLMSVGYVRNV